MRFRPLTLLALCAFAFPAEGQIHTFEHLSPEDGLSHYLVYDILQDHEGYLWFGTRDGLSRFDGRDFKVYRHVPGDPTSLSDSKAWVLFEDRDSVLWVGTIEGGLNRFDRQTETFTHFRHNSLDPYTLSGNRIAAMGQDSAGQLWVATWAAGVNRLDPLTGRVTRIPYQERGIDSATDAQTAPFVFDVQLDPAGRLLISGGSVDGLRGICEMDPVSARCTSRTDLLEGTVRQLHFEESAVWAVLHTGAPARTAYLARMDAETGSVESVAQWAFDGPGDLVRDDYGRFWIGTTDGIRIVDPALGSHSVLRHAADNPLSLASSYLHALHKDRSGNIWAGTKNGVSVTFDAASRFRRAWVDPNRPSAFPRNHVNAILDAEALWLGTNGGLWISDEGGTREVLFRMSSGERRTRRVWSLEEGDDGSIWIGTANSGLYRYEPSCDCAVHDAALAEYRRDLGRPAAPEDGDAASVRSLFESSDGSLWIGTSAEVIRRDEAGAMQLFTHIPGNPYSLSQSFGNVTYEDEIGRIWIGTDGGLNRIDVEYERAIRYTHDPEDGTSISANIVWTIAESEKTPGALWVGTVGGGLNRFDPTTGRFRSFTTFDGLASNNIYGLLTDDHGNLWMSTGAGVSRFDPASEDVTNYDAGDGLLTGGYNLMAFHQSSTSGVMYFGGAIGYSSFHPDSIDATLESPPTVFTGVHIFDTERRGMVSSGDTLRLARDENFFRLSFSALEFANPELTRYRYRLDGFDPQWRSSGGSNPTAVYTAVPPGRYRFVVYGSDRDGVFSRQPSTLHVHIAPLVWETAWFRVVVLLVVVLGTCIALRDQCRHLLSHVLRREDGSESVAVTSPPAG